MEHPAKCEKCGQLWDFGTDGIGRLIALHPIGKCVPPVAPEYETDEEEEIPSERQAKCLECKKVFNLKRFSNARICGNECRKVRRDRKHVESEQRCKLRWALGRAA